MLPQVRRWLESLAALRAEAERLEQRLGGMNVQGQDTGGETVNRWIRTLAGMQEILAAFQAHQIFIKDLARGLVDFPSLVGDKEIFLCWEADEDDIEFWHDLDAGYSGREKLD